MRLRIADPAEILVDREVRSVTAEDRSGRFGIHAGHADFLTVLEVSVVAWQETDGRPGYCAVKKGLLTVNGGDEVAIATREGHVGDDLSKLEAGLRERYHEQGEEERRGRTAAARLRMRAIRHLVEAMGARAASAAFDGGEA